MKNVFIVEVSDSKIPVFPDSCVVCMQPQVEQLRTIQIADCSENLSPNPWFALRAGGQRGGKKERILIKRGE